VAWSIVYADPVVGGASFSWASAGAASYDVGYASSSMAPGTGDNAFNATLYEDIVNVGTSLSWTNTTGSAVYASVRSVDSLGEVGPWSTSEQFLSA
jgi:hypothetical protein